jgi:PEP-CTERM motif
MKNHRRLDWILIRRLAGLILCAAWLASAPAPARAGSVYQVNGDLSALSSGTSIILDFQFNPGVGSYDAATATVSDFTSSNLTLGAASPSGGGSGSLPGGITLDNSTGFNEVFQAASVGPGSASFQFTLTFSGAAISSPSPGATAGTSFGLGVLDSNFNPFVVYGSNDPVLLININAGDPTPVVSTVVTPPIEVSTASVPEPSSLPLAAIGLSMAGIILVLRRRRAAVAVH